MAAANTNGVEKLVQMSALGADPDGPTAYIRTKGEAEDVVQQSSLDWVIIALPLLFFAEVLVVMGLGGLYLGAFLAWAGWTLLLAVMWTVPP